jgi:hypothetical protein
MVTELRAILLMEADFNAFNKIIHGVRMMGQARDHNLMSDEIHSAKIKWRTMGRSLKPISLTLHARPEYQLPLPQSMHQVATRELHMQLPHWSARHSAFQNWQLGPC